MSSYLQILIIIYMTLFLKTKERWITNNKLKFMFYIFNIFFYIEEIICCAAKALDNRGRFAMVHRPERMIEIIELMRKYDIEPKRIRYFLYLQLQYNQQFLMFLLLYMSFLLNFQLESLLNINWWFLVLLLNHFCFMVF